MPDMLYHVVIDTNVLVSALLSGKEVQTATVQILDRVFRGILVPLYNEEILAEYEDVLYREKFGFDKGTVRLILSEIKRIGVRVEAAQSGESFPDPDDRVFFETALAFHHENSDTYLVTGNSKHFPVRPFIVTPRQMINIVS